VRTLLPVAADPAALLAPLVAALDGTGPALLPLPDDAAAAARVLAACRPAEPLETEGVALVVPTSGSTGEPKGVLLSAEALRASAVTTEQTLGGPARWLSALPVTHVGGLQVLVRSLLAGTEPVVLGSRSIAAATDDLGSGRRCTALVPTQLRRALRSPHDSAALTSYDGVLLGGAAAPPGLLRAAREVGIRVVTTYGMTETAGGCVYDGVPLPGVRVAVGGDGRVRLSGPVLASGYRLRPDLTAGAFADGWFATSDLGRWDGRRLDVLGRLDDVVVTGGEKVAPALVEVALAEHPAVAEAAVVGVPDAEWGARVVAVVALRSPLTLAEARAHVAAAVSRVAAPRDLRVVPALPLLDGGKVDRLAVRRLAEAPAAGGTRA
jgi:O-succinylbenzoic acid--CoA ligase